MSVCWEFGVPCYFLFLLMLVFRCWEQILKQENGEPRQPSSRTHLINRERVRCQRFGAAARREEGECPSWIFDRRATLPQRSATLRAKLWRAAGGVAPQSQNALAMLLRRALPVARQSLAHPFPIYEMGSKLGGRFESGLIRR